MAVVILILSSTFNEYYSVIKGDCMYNSKRVGRVRAFCILRPKFVLKYMWL